MCLLYKPLENTMGKGEIARNEQFLLFRQCFPPVFGKLSSIFIKFVIIVCQNMTLAVKVALNPNTTNRLPKLWIWKSTNFVVWERVKDIFHVKHNYV